MSESLSERRLAENEVMFKQLNEQVQTRLEDLKETAHAEGHHSMAVNTDIPVHFYCECSDENCRQRIVLKPSEYKELHQNRSQFVLKPGHNTPGVEHVVHSTDDYAVVEKYEVPPGSSDTLNATDQDNA